MTALDSQAHSPAPPVRLDLITRVIAGSAMVFGGLAALTWLLGVPEVQTVLPGGLPMAAITGLTFMVASLSLGLATVTERPWARPAGLTCAWAVVGIAGMKLGAVAFGWPFWADAWFKAAPDSPGPHHTVMAPSTAAAFLLVGLALLLLRSHSPRRAALAQVPALLAVSLAFLKLVGYLYGVTAFSEAMALFPMSTPTALTFFVLTIGMLFARTDVGVASLLLDRGPGGTLMRRLPPMFVLLPVVLGWLRLEGEYRGYYSLAFGSALMVLAMVAIAMGLLWRNAALLRRAEAESHRAQALLAQQNEDLRRLAEGLQQANDRLVEADRHKDEFLSVVSHELRTPLNFIQGFASLLDDEVSGPLNTEQRRYAEKILTGSDRMLALVEDLLDAARISAGRVELNQQPVPYSPIVQGVIESLGPLAAQKDLGLSCQIDTRQPLWLDPARITQVLTNLVANAIKFTPAGGQIAIRAFAREGWLVTEVSDSGIGIAPDELPRLFERFYQVDMGSTREAGGSGLGLSIARALVEAHGGTIEVDSVPGEGATFRFMVPLSPAEAPTPARAF